MNTNKSNSCRGIVVAIKANFFIVEVDCNGECGGNGVIDNGELFGLATLTGVDNDNIGATNFTFGPI